MIQSDTISENIVDEFTNCTQKIRRINQIHLDWSKDTELLQLKAKIQTEEHPQAILQQNVRYKHYPNNLDRLVLNDEIITQKYYGETRQMKYHQILLPRNGYIRNNYKTLTFDNRAHY